MSDLISREAAIQVARNRGSHAKGETARACRGIEVSISMLPPAQEAAPALAQESADMPYRIFTDTSRVWLDDDDGGSLFPYVREGAAPAAKVRALVWEQGKFSDRWPRMTAETLLGTYEALQWASGDFGGSMPPENREDSNREFSGLSSLEAAKAAAQADYESRIFAALDGGAE